MNARELVIRRANIADLPRLQEIRLNAFEPIFRSFREILGEVIYKVAQQHEDEAQAGLLPDMFKPESEWELFVIEQKTDVLGFISIKLNRSLRVGEIGLNAIHPNSAGNGIGTHMYEYAIEYMKSNGMKVATVGTGGDPSHSAARSAYRKAGFDVEIPSVWMCKEL